MSGNRFKAFRSQRNSLATEAQREEAKSISLVPLCFALSFNHDTVKSLTALTDAFRSRCGRGRGGNEAEEDSK